MVFASETQLESQLEAESDQAAASDALLDDHHSELRSGYGKRCSRNSLLLGVVLACFLVGFAFVLPNSSSGNLVEKSSLAHVEVLTEDNEDDDDDEEDEVKCGSTEDLDKKCKGCGGEQCSLCREEHKVKCCVLEGKGLNTCCKDTPGEIKAGWVCTNAAHCNSDQYCRDACGKGRNSTGCSDCQEKQKIKCCINGGTPTSECCKYASDRNKNNATLCGCAATGGDKDCSKNGCCQDSQKVCYAKNENWGTCKDANSCRPGVHTNDHKDHMTPWSCKALSCADSYKDDCRHSRCCRDSGDACYLKNEGWASCRPKSVGCKAGSKDPHDPEEHSTPWDCTVLSCAEDYSDDCSKTKCCKNPKSECWKKNDKWAACKPSCTPGVDEWDHVDHKTNWTCERVKNWE